MKHSKDTEHIRNKIAKHKLELKEICITDGIKLNKNISLQDLIDSLNRHLLYDWGDISDHDKKLNDESIKNGGRIFSAYNINKHIRIWIITESNRMLTTILLPEEY